MYKKILVPLDGSKIARQVFPCVVEMSNAFGSEAILVGVCDSEESEEGQVCRNYIHNEAEQLKNIMKNSAASVKTVILGGKPAEEIIKYAEKSNIDIIIISSHGRSGIKPWSMGSTVHKVLHRVCIPLIIVRAKEKPEESDETRLFSRILVPLDYSDRSAGIVPYMAALAKKLKVEIILFHVVELGKHVHTIGGLEYVRFNDQDIDKEKEEAQSYLNGIASNISGTKSTVKREIRVGDSAEEIIKLAAEKDCSLIAMSSHGYSGIQGWAYGSVTWKILNTVNKSIMFVPSLDNQSFL